MLIGEENLNKLKKSKVIIFGVGGVGGYVAEALARVGIGQIDIVDNDTINITNINRQIIATHDNIGEYKVDEFKKRIHSINPEIICNAYKTFYLPETADQFDFKKYDYVIDAIDTVTGKLTLVENAQKVNTPIISSLGTGNKLDPLSFKIDDIYKTSVCPLARVMRHECKKRGIKKLKVLYSLEKPSKKENSIEESQRRDIPASISFVPSAGGLIIASEVVKDLIK